MYFCEVSAITADMHSSPSDLQRPEDLDDYKVACLPIIANFLQKLGVFVWNQGRQRKLSRKLKDHQRHYLHALGLPESIFTTPVQTIIHNKEH